MVELMTTIVIIGILAAAAMPAYSEYTKRIRVAEAYVSIDALKKGNAAGYSENKIFATARFGQALDTMPNQGSKAAVHLQELGNLALGDPSFDVAKGYYGPISTSIADGSFHYHAYRIQSGFFDAAGDRFTLNNFASGAPTFSSIGAGDSIASVFFKTVDQAQCTSNFDFDDFAITPQPGDHFSVIMAGGVYDSDLCVVQTQVMLVRNGEISSRPIIEVRLGYAPKP